MRLTGGGVAEHRPVSGAGLLPLMNDDGLVPLCQEKTLYPLWRQMETDIEKVLAYEI